MPTGGIVTILLLFPNLLWMRFAPQDEGEEQDHPAGGVHRLMEVLEWVGRIAALALPFFYRLSAEGTLQLVTLVLMALALLFYYAGWVRYFTRGRKKELLFAPLLGLSIPLAISPIIYLLAASANLHSWPLTATTGIFAVGHLWISAQDLSREVNTNESTSRI